MLPVSIVIIRIIIIICHSLDQCVMSWLYGLKNNKKKATGPKNIRSQANSYPLTNHESQDVVSPSVTGENHTAVNLIS